MMRITLDIKDSTLAEWLQSITEDELLELRADQEAEHELSQVMDERLRDGADFISAEEYLSASKKDN